MTEYEIQKAFVTWCRSHPDERPRLIYAIPNESRRTWSHAQKRRSEGMISGVADLHLPVPVCDEYGYNYEPGLFIEVKTPRGKLTPAQKAFKFSCDEYGYPYHVIRSVDDGIKLITNYLSL